MKKFIIPILAFFAFTFVSAQDLPLKVGVHLDIPMGDMGDISSIGFGFDAAYMFMVEEDYQVGGTIGYQMFSGKSIDAGPFGSIKAPNFGYIPIALTGQYSFTSEIFAGADLGYAIGVAPSGAKGGFYYLPKVGYQMDSFEFYAGYKGIAVSGTSISAITIGANYKFY